MFDVFWEKGLYCKVNDLRRHCDEGVEFSVGTAGSSHRLVTDYVKLRPLAVI